MSLLAHINSYALSLAQSGEWTKVAETLNARTRTVTDPQAWTYAKIGQAISVEVQYGAFAFMAEAAKTDSVLAGAHQLLLLGDGEKVGLRLDDDYRQAQLASLIQTSTNPQTVAVLTAVKSLGRRSVPLLDAPVTSSECQAAWDAEVRIQRNGTLKPRFDAILNQLGTSEHAEGIAALRAMANELELEA